VVISNAAEAAGLAKAREMGLQRRSLNPRPQARRTRRRCNCVPARARVELVCLAGYMRLLRASSWPRFRIAFSTFILAAAGVSGLEAQEQAFAYGAKVTGCTVHFVDEELDHGAIVVQRAVSVLETDDEHSLAERILKKNTWHTPRRLRGREREYEVRGGST